MTWLSDVGNFIALKTNQTLDRILPGRRTGQGSDGNQRALAPFPPARNLPSYAGPAGEGYGTQNQPRPNIQVINDWIVPSTLGWTLEAMQAAILQLENGNMFSAHSLMLAMTRDATVAHGLMLRRMSLAALNKELWFPPEIPEEAREALRKQWIEAITAQDKATAHSYMVMLGLAPMTQTWFEKTEQTGETFWQFRSEVLETGHMQYRPDLRRYYFIARDGYREVVDDGNAWALFKSLGDRRHHLDSAVRTLATLWFIVQEAVRYHRAYNAEYGRPIKGLMVPDTHRLTEDVSQLVQQASGLYGGSVIILPQFGEGQGQANFDLKLIEAKSRGFQTFSELAKTARDLITLYLVGVLETTGGSSASNAKATTQLKVADRYTTGDARVEEDACNRILRRWADFNGFAAAPEWRIDTSPAADEAAAADVAAKKAAALKSTVDALKAMYDMGVRITEDRITATLGQVGLKWTDRGAAEALSPYLATSNAGMERNGSSVLVCWEVPREIGRLLTVPGGEDLEELHLTLALCPDGSVPDVLAGMVAVIGELEAASGYVTGVASWPAMGTDIRSESAEAVLPERESKAGGGLTESAEGEEAASQVSGGETEEREEQTNSLESEPALGGKGPSKVKSLTVRPSVVRQLAGPVSVTGGSNTGSGQLAFVSLVDAPTLGVMRDKLVAALTAAGVSVADNHGFIPHITRAYLPAGSSVDAPGKPIPMKVDRLSVWAMGGKVRIPMRVGRVEQAIA